MKKHTPGIERNFFKLTKGFYIWWHNFRSLLIKDRNKTKMYTLTSVSYIVLVQANVISQEKEISVKVTNKRVQSSS